MCCLLAPLQNGEVSNANVTLSYAECQPGSFQRDLNCPLSAAGSYAPGLSALECSACEAGTWSQAGASRCRNCARGTFSGRGASTCTNWFESLAGAVAADWARSDSSLLV